MRVSPFRYRLPGAALALGLAISGLGHAAPSLGNDCFGPPPHAGEHHGHRGPLHAEAPPWMFPRLPRFLDGLELDEAQQDKIFSILHEQAPKVRALDKTIRTSHADLRAIRTAERFDEKAAREIAATAARAMAEMTVLHARSEHQILSLLTPEQRQVVESNANRFERHGAPGRRGPAVR